MFRDPPPFAAWRHLDAREGYEVVFLAPAAGAADAARGWRVEGTTAAVEEGEPWVVSYAIDLDARWRTRRAVVSGRARHGRAERVLEADGEGRWTVDGRPRPDLDGCLDVDLESSSFTNAFPVHNLGLAVDEGAEAPAAYVRALDLGVERLEQRYVRLDDSAASGPRYDYTSPAFAFRCELAYDASGLVLDYPGIATRRA
jgi:hypothetical protein